MNRDGRIRRTTIFPAVLLRKQVSDAGMVLVLIFLFLELLLKSGYFYKIAFILLLINIIAPKLFYPFAVFWYGLSDVLALFVPKMVLFIIFLLVVAPVGLLRQLFGRDSLLLKAFKKGDQSVMFTRDYTFSSSDIEKPY